MRIPLAFACSLLFLLAACSGGVTDDTDMEPTDGGHGDAGLLDAGHVDSGATDLGTTDSGAADLGTADSGVVDSGTTDSGIADSGGAPDSGITDAGVPDLGIVDTDGGLPVGSVCTSDAMCAGELLCCGGGAVGRPRHCTVAMPPGRCPLIP